MNNNIVKKFVKMNVIVAVKLYIEKMANEAGPGLKILLMDKETVRMQRLDKKINN